MRRVILIKRVSCCSGLAVFVGWVDPGGKGSSCDTEMGLDECMPCIDRERILYIRV